MTINDINNNNVNCKPMVDYNRLKQLQEDSQFLINLKASVPLLAARKQEALVIGDLGCAQGKHSMSVIKQFLDELCNHPDYTQQLSQLTFYHEDLPGNNFEEVVKCIEDPEIGYLAHNLIKSSKVKVNYSCIGKSFYEVILPPNSLDLAFCYNSLLFLPEYKSTKYGFTYTADYNDNEETNWFNEVANKYLGDFLNSRHLELKSGGVLSINIPTWSNFQVWINSGWKLAFQKFELNYEDFDKCKFPIYYRPKEQVEKVLKAYGSKFRLVNQSTELVETQVNEETKEDTRNRFKAIIYEYLMEGLKQYSEAFKDQKARDELFEEFVNCCLNMEDHTKTTIVIEWLVLQKI